MKKYDNNSFLPTWLSGERKAAVGRRRWRAKRVGGAHGSRRGCSRMVCEITICYGGGLAGNRKAARCYLWACDGGRQEETERRERQMLIAQHGDSNGITAPRCYNACHDVIPI